MGKCCDSCKYRWEDHTGNGICIFTEHLYENWEFKDKDRWTAEDLLNTIFPDNDINLCEKWEKV